MAITTAEGLHRAEAARLQQENLKPQNLNALISAVINWHYDRNLIDGSSDKDQFHKLIQECAELSDNICKKKDIKDDVGDILVVLLNIVERHGLTLEECLQVAYNDIKDRKGKMVDGVFVKGGDL